MKFAPVLLLLVTALSMQIQLLPGAKGPADDLAVSIKLLSDRQIITTTAGKSISLLNVPDVFQFYNYSSGHSAL